MWIVSSDTWFRHPSLSGHNELGEPDEVGRMPKRSYWLSHPYTNSRKESLRKPRKWRKIRRMTLELVTNRTMTTRTMTTMTRVPSKCQQEMRTQSTRNEWSGECGIGLRPMTAVVLFPTSISQILAAFEVGSLFGILIVLSVHYFEVHDPRHCCCDLCVLKKVKNKEELTARESHIYQLHKRINSRFEALDASAPKQPKARKAIGLGRRRDERLEACKNTLTDWQAKTYASEFKHCIFGPQALMSDKILTKLASCADIKTVEAIKGQIPDWVWADEYGEAVLRLLEPIDSAWKAETTAKAKENRAKKAKVKAEAKQTEAVPTSQYMQPLLSIPVNVMAHPFNPQGPILFPALHQHLPIIASSAGPSVSTCALRCALARHPDRPVPSAIRWILPVCICTILKAPSVPVSCSVVKVTWGTRIFSILNTHSSRSLKTTRRCGSEPIDPLFSSASSLPIQLQDSLLLCLVCRAFVHFF